MLACERHWCLGYRHRILSAILWYVASVCIRPASGINITPYLPPGFTAAQLRGSGFVSLVAGSNDTTDPAWVDGTGSGASFASPGAIAVDSAEILYIADTDNHVVRRCTPVGVVTTLAGTGVQGHLDGPFSSAKFSSPAGIALDAAGTVLYVADSSNHVIRMLDLLTSTVSTLAGQPGVSGFADGALLGASLFYYPRGLRYNTAWGGLLIADSFNHRIRLVDVVGATGVTTIAGSAVKGSADGDLGVNTLSYPTDVALEVAGGSAIVYLVQAHSVRSIQSTAPHTVTTLMGSSSHGYADAANVNALFFAPSAMTITPDHIMYIADSANHLVRYVDLADPSLNVKTLVGDRVSLSFGSVNAGPDNARLRMPVALAGVSALRNDTFLYVADAGNHQIRRMTALCTPVCQNGGWCVSPDTCVCAVGFTDATCSTPVCATPCPSGQICIGNDVCQCPAGYTGAGCTVPVCSSGCANGGSCVAPDTCSCTAGWSGPSCATPICAPACANGGTCIAPNTCSCAAFWSGAACTVPVCAPSCQNSGTCLPSNACNCTSGWSGTRCQTPVCAPACQNGGTCTAPNTCACGAQWQGVDCSLPSCVLPCLNGASCSTPDTCDCAPGWTGTQCQTAVCAQVCQNGGTCSAPNTCSCTAGWR